MLHALVHGKDGEVARPGQAAMIEERRQRTQHAVGAVRGCNDLIHEVRPRKVQHVRRDRLALVLQKVLRLVAEKFFDLFNVLAHSAFASLRCQESVKPC